MGAWGVGHFENDVAGDWVWELEDAKSLGPVEQAIATVEAATDYLEAPDATDALWVLPIVSLIMARGLVHRFNGLD